MTKIQNRKILIIGANGQLAFDLIRVFSAKDGSASGGENDYEVINATRDNFDVTDGLAVEKFIKNRKPNIVINTAAYHKTEECELNPEKSFQVNAIGAYNVAKTAASVGARIIFISTDYVFDGSKESFTEDDTPNPLNVYGASKLAGEVLTKVANADYYIIRTSWLFGIHRSSKGHNFVTLMLEKAKNGEQIKVVNDQFGSPTYTHDLALKIKELIDKNVPAGVYHVTNSGSCSWYEFAKKIFELLGLNADLTAINSSERPSAVKRPKYSALMSGNLKRQGIKNLRSWPEALSVYLSC